jgi:hypothetical protein
MIPTPLLISLEASIATNKPRLVVIDSVAAMFDGEAIARRQVRAFLTMLRKIAKDHDTAAARPHSHIPPYPQRSDCASRVHSICPADAASHDQRFIYSSVSSTAPKVAGLFNVACDIRGSRDFILFGGEFALSFGCLISCTTINIIKPIMVIN